MDDLLIWTAYFLGTAIDPVIILCAVITASVVVALRKNSRFWWSAIPLWLGMTASWMVFNHFRLAERSSSMTYPLSLEEQKRRTYQDEVSKAEHEEVAHYKALHPNFDGTFRGPGDAEQASLSYDAYDVQGRDLLVTLQVGRDSRIADTPDGIGGWDCTASLTVKQVLYLMAALEKAKQWASVSRANHLDVTLPKMIWQDQAVGQYVSLCFQSHPPNSYDVGLDLNVPSSDATETTLAYNYHCIWIPERSFDSLEQFLGGAINFSAGIRKDTLEKQERQAKVNNLFK